MRSQPQTSKQRPLQTKRYNETYPFTTPAKTIMQGSSGGTTKITQAITSIANSSYNRYTKSSLKIYQIRCNKYNKFMSNKKLHQFLAEHQIGKCCLLIAMH